MCGSSVCKACSARHLKDQKDKEQRCCDLCFLRMRNHKLELYKIKNLEFCQNRVAELKSKIETSHEKLMNLNSTIDSLNNKTKEDLNVQSESLFQLEIEHKKCQEMLEKKRANLEDYRNQLEQKRKTYKDYLSDLEKQEKKNAVL